MVEASKIQVAEMGNKRTSISDQDLAQFLKDLASWLESNAADHYNEKMKPVANAASEAQVAELMSKFSGSAAHLALSLQKFNGGVHYQDTFIGLSVDQISEKVGQLSSESLIPFASDIDGTLLCLKVDQGETIVSYDTDSNSVSEDLKMSYGQYLEDICQKILTGKLIYEDGMGLVSVA